MRSAGVLAELLGADELGEDELLLRRRELGLITYPSPLGRLLERPPEVFAAEVLPRLDPTELTLLARVGHACRAAVAASGLPRAGASLQVPLKSRSFGSVERLAWARADRCPWGAGTCGLVAKGGHREVLWWAREHGCPWDEDTCMSAARGGGGTWRCCSGR